MARDSFRERLRGQLIARSTARAAKRTRSMRTRTRAGRSPTSSAPSPAASCKSSSGRCCARIPALDAPSVAAPARARPQLAESRKTVTVLIADVGAGRRARRPGRARRAAVLEVDPRRGAELDRHGASSRVTRRRARARRVRRPGGAGRRLAAGGHGGRRAPFVCPLLVAGSASRPGEVVTGDPIVSGRSS